MTSSSPTGLRLHLGCGTTIVPGWINIDGSWNARLARYPRVRRLLGALSVIPREIAAVRWSAEVTHHDVRSPLPFPDGSVAAAYTSHMVEHLHREEALALLRELHRVLAPGGVVRIVVPDLRVILLRYADAVRAGETAAPGEPTAADRVNQELLLRPAAPERRGLAYRLYSAMTDFHWHKWMYDADSLVALVRSAGFVEVEPRGLYESRIPGIEAIENPSRIENGAGICVEAVRASSPAPLPRRASEDLARV